MEGEFEIALKAEGPNCPAGETVKTFERSVFPWEELTAGHSTKVYRHSRPFKSAAARFRRSCGSMNSTILGCWTR